jgi:prepilin-type N-terminal cleavage/methylation domain-containing protein/prepilin-type processing-associated H-X9-DG protein
MRRKGFTLIELLVVIAIIAILAAILFPVFSRARRSALSSACLSNVKQIGLAMQQYIIDYDHFCPFVTTASGTAMPGMNGTLWWGLYKYTQNAQIFTCPLSPDTPVLATYTAAQITGGAVNVPQVGYFANEVLSRRYKGGAQTASANLENVPDPSVVIAFADSNRAHGSGTAPNYTDGQDANMNRSFGNPYGNTNGTFGTNIICGNPWAATLFTWPHNRGINVGWLDGHANFIQASPNNYGWVTPLSTKSFGLTPDVNDSYTTYVTAFSSLW